MVVGGAEGAGPQSEALAGLEGLYMPWLISSCSCNCIAKSSLKGNGASAKTCYSSTMIIMMMMGR